MATAIWAAAPADPKACDYARYHARRVEIALATCMAACPSRSAAVLDIGRSELTDALRRHYANVWTLGFPAIDPRHITFDLNDARQGPPTQKRFDMIVFAEVLEHLYTAPETVLAMLRRMLVPGGQIVLQTPNAAALTKRLKLLCGANPYERIRTDTANPGHFREYTRRELIEIAASAGLQVVSHRYAEYFGCYGGGLKQRIGMPALRLIAALAPSLARGQTLVLRHPHAISPMLPS